ATFEVYPEIQLKALDDVVIERPTVVPGEVEVDKTVEILRKQRVGYEPEERGAQLGDRITFDYRGTRGVQEFEGGSGTDHVTVLGEGRLLGDFEKQVVGLRAGESRPFELTFPEDYHAKELAGKSAQFDVA